MAKDKPKGPKAPRVKQGFLPDMAPPSHKDVETAADDYVEARDARIAAMAPEAEAKELLKGLMKKHNLSTYEYDSRIVTMAGDPDVKVRKKKTEEVEIDE